VRAYQPQRVRPVNLDGMRKNVRLAENGRWYWHWDPKMMAQRPDSAEMDRLAARVRAAAAVRIPVLLVRGQLSDVVSEEGAADLLATIPHAKYTDVAGAGHMVAGDDNSMFLDRVAEFLDSEVRLRGYAASAGASAGAGLGFGRCQNAASCAAAAARPKPTASPARWTGVSLLSMPSRRSTLRLPGPIAASATEAALRFSTYS
jgi:hypothetical protein